MKEKILAARGSIQGIPEIPDYLKVLYKTAFEIKQKVLLDMAADRGPYIDQTQSTNLFFAKPTPSSLSSALFYAFKAGLKTGVYYLHTQTAAAPQQVTVSARKKPLKPVPEGKVEILCEDEVCVACSA
jgi:ribonucleoside-diphosphate reductase alpha chain